MKSIKRLCIIAGFACIGNLLFAQEDFSSLLNQRIQKGENFQSIQKFAEYWFKTHPSGRGSGYKQYKRWEYDMSFQVSGDGLLPGGKQNSNLEKAQNFSRSSAPSLQNTGANWANLSQSVPVVDGGKNSGAGRVSSWAFQPGSNNVMISTPMGGMWKGLYLQGSDSYLWSPYGDALPNPGILQVCYNYNNSNIIYALTGGRDFETRFSAGVLKSVDAGLSWQPTGLKIKEDQQVFVRKLLMHPTNPECLFTLTNGMLLKTLNGGLNWDTLKYGDFTDVAFKPGSTRMYLASSDAFYYSDNLGDNFYTTGTNLPATAGYNVKIGLTAADPETIFLLYGGGSFGFYRLMRSKNGGTSFFIRSFGNANTNPLGYCDNNKAECGYNTTGQVFRNCEIAVSPTNAASVFVGGINVWESADSGVTWTIRAKWEEPNSVGYAHADIHALEVKNGSLYCASDGGFYRMNLATKVWKPFTDNLSLAQVYRVGGVNDTELFWGCQDNGVNAWKSGSYRHVICCDGTSAVQAPSNSNIIYASIQAGSFSKSSNAGLTFPTRMYPPTQLGTGTTSCNCDDTTGGAWVTPIVVSPTNSSKLYVGYRKLYKSLNGGTSWEVKELPSTTSPITAMAISPQDDNMVYMARNTYRIFRTTDGAATINELSLLSTALTITAIAVDPSNKNHIYVSLGGYINGNKVYEGTVDANGLLTWTNITGSLPNMPFYTITATANNGVYVGGDVGVYYRNSQTNGWVSYGNGLPNTSIRDLRVVSNQLIAGTFGRGVWKTGLFVTCPADYVHDAQSGLNNVNGQEFYQASNSIVTNVSVSGGAGAALVYKAGNYIDLKPGFRATSGTAMVSQILPCNTQGILPAQLIPLTGK
ncbi:MAG: 3-coathanger stack domain-containing protein [Bacteroidota bacterium]